MSDKSLIVRDDARLAISFTPEALQMQAAALESAALVGRVACAEDQLLAVEAQKHLAALLRMTEASRKAVKEPVLSFGRMIDDAAKKFADELRAEEMRIAKLISDFQALEMAKVRAAQHAENERLLAIERERQAELAQAKSHDELDRVNAHFEQRVQDERPAPVVPVRVAGQIVKEDWAFEICDVWALAKAHPECVNPPEPRRREIKSLLDMGMKVTGVRAWKVTQATVSTRKL